MLRVCFVRVRAVAVHGLFKPPAKDSATNVRLCSFTNKSEVAFIVPDYLLSFLPFSYSESYLSTDRHGH